jgi:RNA polymerase sigma factor (sigma-70 family)
MQQKADDLYINSVLSGNISDYSIIVDKYKDMVYTIAYRIVGNREDAEELAQDVFVKAYTSLKDFKGKSKFSTWLYSIAYNTSISKIRRKRLKSVSLDERNDTFLNIADDVHEDFYNFDKVPVGLLKQALDELNPVDKSLLALFYQDDRSIKELAEITGLTESNVKVRLFRNRQKLFHRLRTLYGDELTDLL